MSYSVSAGRRPIDDIRRRRRSCDGKAAGVVIDDTAVTPHTTTGSPLSVSRRIIKHIAIGSVRNKLLLILPVHYQPARAAGC